MARHAGGMTTAQAGCAAAMGRIVEGTATSRPPLRADRGDSWLSGSDYSVPAYILSFEAYRNRDIVGPGALRCMSMCLDFGNCTYPVSIRISNWQRDRSISRLKYLEGSYGNRWKYSARTSDQGFAIFSRFLRVGLQAPESAWQAYCSTDRIWLPSGDEDRGLSRPSNPNLEAA